MGYRNSYRSRGNRGGRNRSRGSRRSKSANTTNINKYIAVADTPTQTEKRLDTVKYADLNLHNGLNVNLNQKGYTQTTLIQDKAIPVILDGFDLLGISPTGSGKTGAFLIPMVEKMLNDRDQKVLVVAPTRELAMQIHAELISLIKGTYIRAALIIGGESMSRQIKALSRKVDIIIGTPGRIHDMRKRGHLKMDRINNIILDEVDRMLDMGFINDIQDMFKFIQNERQALFFSATIDDRVQGIVKRLASNDFKTISLAENEPGKYVNQDVVAFHDKQDKFDQLHTLLNKDEVAKSIIFVQTKHFADKVTITLEKSGFKADTIHGGKTQGRRKRVINAYRDNKINILVSTNVAARGLDIEDITHVINFDEPENYDEYIHRIGRTGRNGKTGFAYTFVEHHRVPNN